MTLTLDDVVLTYPDGDRTLTALDRVSLHVPAGTLTAVLGPSGSGKSSLLAVAATLITPDAGTVHIDGVPTAGADRAALTTLRREKVGIVFQQPNLLGSLTCAEQLQVMAHLDGRSPESVRQKAADLLHAVGLSDKADRRPHQLSGGQRQRVAIARALMNDPAVLLVDEPTSALDRERGAEVLALISQLTRERDSATVLVTHDPSHREVADDVAEMLDGALTRSSAPSGLR